MYARRLLNAGEEISLLRHPHPASVARIALTGVVLVLGAFGLLMLAAGLDPLEADGLTGALLALLGDDPQSRVGWLALVVCLFGLLVCGMAWATWRSTEYAVIAGPGGGRLLRVSGILSKRSVAAPLNKINDLVLLEPILGRLLGYGELQVRTGNDYSGQVLRYVPDPQRFYSVCRALRLDDGQPQLHETRVSTW